MAIPLLPLAMGLSEFAPVIARWMSGSSAQEVASQVVETAKKVTGCEDAADMIRRIDENPDLVRAFQKEIIKLEADFELNFLMDRQNARSRDLAFIQAGRRNLRADIMVISAALGLIVCLGTISWFADSMPGEAVGIISTIAGIFGACLKDAYAFEFGSSRGSREKDNTVAALVDYVR
jgi:hypothetical protein